jgi:hypothetical protein
MLISDVRIAPFKARSEQAIIRPKSPNMVMM